LCEKGQKFGIRNCEKKVRILRHKIKIVRKQVRIVGYKFEIARKQVRIVGYKLGIVTKKVRIGVINSELGEKCQNWGL